MDVDVCRQCINEWAEKNSVPEWRWNHTVFDDSFLACKVIHCPVASDNRSKAFSFEKGIPEDCCRPGEHVK